MCSMLTLPLFGSLFPCKGAVPNNLNQIAIHANTYGVYPEEIKALQKDYAELWGRVSTVLKQLAAVVEL